MLTSSVGYSIDLQCSGLGFFSLTGAPVLTIALAYTATHFDLIHRLISSGVEHLEIPGGRRFDSYISHPMEVRSVVEHWTSNPTVTGSTPVLPTKRPRPGYGHLDSNESNGTGEIPRWFESIILRSALLVFRDRPSPSGERSQQLTILARSHSSFTKVCPSLVTSLLP
jgi:hypothetical protein